jgi:hypothetical protein
MTLSRYHRIRRLAVGGAVVRIRHGNTEVAAAAPRRSSSKAKGRLTRFGDVRTAQIVPTPSEISENQSDWNPHWF